MLLTVHGETSASHASLSSACMLQVTHPALQQSTSVSTEDLHTDTSSSDSSDESDSNREGEEDKKAAAGSTGEEEEEEEEMRASSSGRGDSDEVAELKRQLAASQDQLRASQHQLAASQDNLRNERLYVDACEVVVLLILNPIISSGQT